MPTRPGPRTPAAKEVNDDRQIVVLFQHQISITREIVFDLINQLGGVCIDEKKKPRVDVWLESPGGDAHAAYKLALYLRSRFEVVNVIVPDYAKSAATLMALGADTIYMSPCAELGPLDMQEAREGEMRPRSALDTAHSIEALFHRAIENALVEGANVLQATRLSREKAVSHVLDFASVFYRPLIEQLDPLAIYAASTGLLVTIEYGTRLLQASNPDVLKEILQQRVSTLVTGYPTHGFVIDRNEARTLGLPVKDLWEYDMKDEVEALYRYQQDAEIDLVSIKTRQDFTEKTSETETNESSGGTGKVGKAKESNGTALSNGSGEVKITSAS